MGGEADAGKSGDVCDIFSSVSLNENKYSSRVLPLSSIIVFLSRVLEG